MPVTVAVDSGGTAVATSAGDRVAAFLFAIALVLLLKVDVAPGCRPAVEMKPATA